MQPKPYPKDPSQNYSAEEFLAMEITEDVLYIATITVFIVALIVLLSDLYLIAIIVRFKKLRKRLNAFIVLYAVAHINSILIGLLYVTLEGFAMSFIYYSLTLLAIDWYVRSYHQTFFKQYGTVFIIGIGLAFLATSIISTLLIMFLSPDNLKAYDLAEVVSFVFSSTILLCISILRWKKQPVINIGKTVYAITVPQVLFSISAITYILQCVIAFIPGSTYMGFIIILQTVNGCITMTQTLVMLFVLSKLNKHFRMAHRRCFKRSLPNDYSDDDLDSISNNEIPESNIAFNRNTELVEMEI